MTRYTKEYIAKLLDKYMDGTSTLEEEDILADYFHHGNVPEEWEDYRQLFSEIEAMKPQPKVKKRWIGWSVAASVAVLFIAIMWQQTEQPHTEQTSAILTAKADTVSSSQVEQKTDSATFQKLAAHGYIPVMQEDGTIIYIHEQTELLSYEE